MQTGSGIKKRALLRYPCAMSHCHISSSLSRLPFVSAAIDCLKRACDTLWPRKCCRYAPTTRGLA